MLKQAKQTFFLLLFLTLTLQSSPTMAGFYLSGGIGMETNNNSSKNQGQKTWEKSYYGAIGYALPFALSAEAFYSYHGQNIIGADARFTFMPFFNLKGGTFTTVSEESNQSGVLGGVGFNFWPIPKFDLFADATYYTNIKTIEGLMGLRYHF